MRSVTGSRPASGLAVRLVAALLAVAVLVGVAVAEPAAPDPLLQWRQLAARLAGEVEATPADVDLRLRLALALAWSGRHEDARREARVVLTQAPNYLDAELLLARLAAWEHDWRQASAHLARVLAAQPAHADARLLAADVALWSGDVAAARVAVAALPVGAIADVDRWYREALLAAAERNPRRARTLARRILAADPGHAGARALRTSAYYLSVESASDVERYPTGYAQRFATGETLTVSAFPGARWSATLIYEYRRRFATNNHRLAARGDWRLDERWSLLGLLRGGVVEVVPQLTAAAEVRRDERGWSIGGRYTYDRMPWPGSLHRVQALLGAPITRRLRIEGEGFVGLLRGCDEVRGVWGARARLGWTAARWELGAGGGHGLEADRGISAALQTDPCAGTTRDLIQQDVSAGALDVTWRVRPRWTVRVSGGAEARPAAVWIAVGGVAVRAWF